MQDVKRKLKIFFVSLIEVMIRIIAINVEDGWFQVEGVNITAGC